MADDSPDNKDPSKPGNDPLESRDGKREWKNGCNCESEALDLLSLHKIIKIEIYQHFFMSKQDECGFVFLRGAFFSLCLIFLLPSIFLSYL